MYWPEELEVQARLGQEELVILLEPHLAHGSVLEEMNTDTYKHTLLISYSLKVNSVQSYSFLWVPGNASKGTGISVKKKSIIQAFFREQNMHAVVDSLVSLILTCM